jgi:hypothetical protein
MEDPDPLPTPETSRKATMQVLAARMVEAAIQVLHANEWIQSNPSAK